MSIFNKNLINENTWTLQEFSKVLNLAQQMKKDRYSSTWSNFLKNKTFLLMFYNPSLRTRLSFHTGVQELGGFVQTITPDMTWLKKNLSDAGESIEDSIRVISRYASGIGIRVTLDKVTQYGEGHRVLNEFAKSSNIPIISMADDKYHPCQGLSDIMGWSEFFSKRDGTQYIDNLKKKKLLITWASSPLIRPRSSVQSHLLMASKFGMNIVLARPSGYDLDKDVYCTAERYCKENQTKFEITHLNEECYKQVDVVYARNWLSEAAYQEGELLQDLEKKKSLEHSDWIVDSNKMKQTNNAIFANPMPVIRNYEATNEVVDSKHSVIYDVAENRLHVQKALLSLILNSNVEGLLL